MARITSVQGYGPKKDGACKYVVGIEVPGDRADGFLGRLEAWLVSESAPVVEGTLVKVWFQRLEINQQPGVAGIVFAQDSDLEQLPSEIEFEQTIGWHLAHLRNLIRDHYRSLHSRQTESR